ncbi:hypothetical protein GOP47_0021812 [Adiantum capillus-veneris]|uniref:Cytochrome P450 n=1 Tax=Adiantum capillus-veneris TaxID=13818 RepID=A0A9D4Z6X0_ADICA|nr:hypothetical protein GOP47_0021812 [Adiantum capillus-veneris]
MATTAAACSSTRLASSPPEAWGCLCWARLFTSSSARAHWHPAAFLSSRLRRYGTVFKTHLLGRPTVVSMDPELSKFLLANEDKLVKVYLPHFITKLLGPTVCLQGASHRAFRELANLSVNSNAIQRQHLDAVQEHYLACLRSWHQGPSSPAVVEAQQQCREWAFTYSVKYFLGLEHDDPITAALMQDFFLLLDGVASIPINLPGTTFNKALKASKRINFTIGKLVRSRRLEPRKEAKDFLDILLKRIAGSGDEYGGLHVADWIYAFVLAAYENTAILFANILKFLSENEHVIHELQRENFPLQKTKPNNEKLTWEDYQSMRFTKNVVKETLRMASIAPYVFRLSLEDICFKGTLIPRGWMVVLDFSTVHLNSNYYPDPLRFDPWRWMDSTNNSDDFLVPFGGGPRRCPGSMLAVFEATIFLHYLVNLYKWKRLHRGDELDDARDCLSVPILRKGLFLKLESLNPGN